MARRSHRDTLRRARDIELLVLDVDGVLTDGGLYYGPQGEALKRFDVKDGHGLVLARLAGLRAAILSARRSAIVEARGKELGINPICQGMKDKSLGLEELLGQARVDATCVCYMGDDVNDLCVMRAVRLCACPADARPEVRRIAHYVTRAAGGRGAVREIVELLLKAQDRWPASINR
jgi:3-deoxy-D-manno-octulosonate 8-phosphate phosphatase (KDO 8-P phosphatase)